MFGYGGEGQPVQHTPSVRVDNTQKRFDNKNVIK